MEPIDLPSIEGLDTAAGIMTCNDSRKTYISTLRIFLKDAAARITRMRRDLDEASWEAYGLQVHALKSAAASIGAFSLSQEAAELELAVKDGNHGYIVENDAPFIAHMQEMLGALGGFFQTKKVRSEDDSPVSPELLHNMRSALREYDVVAIEEIMKQLKQQGSQTLLEELEEYILLYEYEKAASRIDEIFESEGQGA